MRKKNKHVKRAEKRKTDEKNDGPAYLDGGRGSWSRMTTDLAAVLTGSLLVVELQLLGRAAVVIAD